MRKIGWFIVSIVMLVIILPILILGGIGPGIKLIPEISKKISPVSNSKSTVHSVKMPVHLTIKVFIKNKIVTMNFEDYIDGVVAAEMPIRFSDEAIKAQAVTARTYALSKMLQFGGSGCVRHKGADVCSEIHCQAYMSKEERMKSWGAAQADANWKRLTELVGLTAGKVIAYNNKLARGVKYFSTSNGKTEDSKAVFGYSEPYLVPVSSGNEQESPSFSSTASISRKQFLSMLHQVNAGFSLKANSERIKINVIQRTLGGRIQKISIGGFVFSGQQLREAFQLKSTDFKITFLKNNVVFSVRGYGHGVGLSQWGANEMGKRGSSYQSIIEHYFTGTKVESMEALQY